MKESLLAPPEAVQAGDLVVDRHLKHVALIVESFTAPRRGMISGVAKYIREHEPWALFLKPVGVLKSVHQWLEHWKGDGIIAAVDERNRVMLDHARIPLVDIAGLVPGCNLPLVHADDYAIGRAGAGHLIDRGFRHMGFCEQPDAPWSMQRRVGFVETVMGAGALSCRVYEFAPLSEAGGPQDFERQQESLVRWILELPKPVGVMTSTDLMGQQFLEACLRAGIRVPEEVAVIGADNDEPICQVSYPPLSSVVIDDHRRGYEAAALLDRLMAGKPAPTKPILVEPSGIAFRASTDILAIDDSIVADAMRFIRQNACTGIDVTDVAAKVPVSRRVLERRFRKAFGRSIHQEITRMRLNHAVELLTRTDLQLKVIAGKSGFGTQSYMSTVFRTELNRTPKSFRTAPPQSAMRSM